MNKANGFIVLHRKILDWEWYNDVNTFRLFVHLLLTANHEDHEFHGRIIKRGQVATSLTNLATSVSLTIRQTRTSLEHLISTGEVTNESTNQYRVISIVNYDKYQDYRQAKRQAIDKRPTNEEASNRQANRQQYNNINNINNINNNKSIGGMPPTLEDISTYIKEIGGKVDPEKFYDHYASCGWVLKGGQKMKDWRAAVRNWERRESDGRKGYNGNSGIDKGTNGEIRQDYSFLYEQGGIVQL